jgi:hypothetical protein
MSAKQKYRSVEIDTNKIGKDAAGDGYYYVRVLQSKTRDARDARTQPLRIAPCGINCALCSGYQRTVNTCPGCLSDEPGPSYCRECSIKLCEKKTSPADLCINCEDYPCRRMKQLEKRYREKYGETIFESMQTIKKEGMDSFIQKEQEKWTCRCGSLLCVHKAVCMQCGEKNPHFIGTEKKTD